MKKRMSKRISTLIITISVIFSLLALPASATHPFNDIDNPFWDDFITFVYDNGIMSGVTTDKFSPNANMTRAMVVMALYQANGSPSVTSPNTFTDVSDSDWYNDAISWASQFGIVKGASDTLFCPNDPVTREAFAVMLYRYTDIMHGPSYLQSLGNLSSFTDESQVSSWALTAVRWAVGNDIMNGVSTTALVPGASATRAQVAKMLTILFQDHLGTIGNDDEDKEYTVTVKVYGAGVATEYTPRTDVHTGYFDFGTVTVGTDEILPNEVKKFPVKHGKSFKMDMHAATIFDWKNDWQVIRGRLDYVEENNQKRYYDARTQEATYTINSVKADKEIKVYFSLERFNGISYDFANDYPDFGYAPGDQIPEARFLTMYPNEISTTLHNTTYLWQGACFGMVTTATLILKSEVSNITAASFSEDYVRPRDVLLSDKSKAISNMSLLEFIECLHVAQYSVQLQAALRDNQIVAPYGTVNDVTDFCNAVNQYAATGKDPLVLMLAYSTQSGHVVFPYEIRDSQTDSNIAYLMVYDPNFPDFFKNVEPYILLYKGENGSYFMDRNYGTAGLNEVSVLKISDIMNLWNNRGHLNYNGNSGPNYSHHLLRINQSDTVISNSNDQRIEIEDRKIKHSEIEDAYIVSTYDSLVDDTGNILPAEAMDMLVWLPEDTYTFNPAAGSNPTEITLASGHSRVVSEISSKASITINLTGEDINNHSAIIHGATGDEYAVTFSYSEESGAEFDDFTVSGTMQEAELTVQKSEEGLEITGAATIDAERLDFNQTVIQNPGIIPIAETVVLDGNTAKVISGAMEQLSVPTNLQFDATGLAAWDAVTDAEKYQVQLYLDGSPVGSWVDVVLSDTEYSFEDDMTELGGYTYAVRAIGDGVAHANSPIAVFSEPKHLLVALDQPESLVFTRGVATWDEVDNATGYQVQLYKEGVAIGNWSIITECTHYFGALMTDSMAEYTFSVIAIGDGVTYKNSKVAILEDGSSLLPQLDEPGNVRFRQGIATWDAVENAADYYITLYRSGEVVDVIRTLDLTVDFNSYIIEYGTYYYEIRAVGDGILYANSPTVTSTKYYHTEPSTSTGTTTYQITVTQGEGGTITPNTSSVAKGSSKTFTIAPASGYQIQAILVDNVSVGAVSTYTFNDVQTSHTITAQFVQTAAGTGIPFVDATSSDWYYDAVKFVYENAIMNGTDQTHFSPDAATTRGMLVTMLYRMEGSPAIANSHAFQDVATATYYNDAISWAAANEIVTGYDNRAFGPDDLVQREQLVTILSRYATYLGEEVTSNSGNTRFTDDGLISSYAKSAILWAVETGLIKGKTVTTICPQDTATRAEVATILMRFVTSLER